MKLSDEDLKKLQNRDPIIFEKIFKAYKNNLYDYLVIKAHGNKEIAEEVLCETFYSAIKSADKLKSVKNILSWMLQIANRRFYDFLRKEYGKKNLIQKISINYNDGFNDAEKELEEKEKILLTELAMRTLKKNYKEVLELKYREHKSNEQIAEIMNISIIAVNSLLYKARKLLKNILKDLLKE